VTHRAADRPTGHDGAAWAVLIAYLLWFVVAAGLSIARLFDPAIQALALAFCAIVAGVMANLGTRREWALALGGVSVIAATFIVVIAIYRSGFMA
jgi:hypothetical protein